MPVVRIARTEERPGGAANVARNVAALGAHAMLLSATGEDEPARCAVAAARDRSHPHVVPSRRGADHDGEAARHRPPAAAAAHRLRDRAAARAAGVATRRVRARCCRCRCARAVRLRQGRSRAHRDDDRSRPRGRQARAGRPEGRRLGPLSRRDGASRPIAANSARWRAARGTKRTSTARAGAAPAARRRGAAGHALGGGHEPLLGRGRADAFPRRRARCSTFPAPATR